LACFCGRVPVDHSIDIAGLVYLRRLTFLEHGIRSRHRLDLSNWRRRMFSDVLLASIVRRAKYYTYTLYYFYHIDGRSVRRMFIRILEEQDSIFI
jgi:hypothetical protein